jgi:excisionase family DNA binding protein
MSDTREYLTLKEVAEISRLSISTIRKLIKSGRLKALKPSWKFVIARTDLDSFMRGSQSNPELS